MEHSGTPLQRAARYRQQAEQLREMAGVAPTDEASKQLRIIADQYDRIADRLENGQPEF